MEKRFDIPLKSMIDLLSIRARAYLLVPEKNKAARCWRSREIMAYCRAIEEITGRNITVQTWDDGRFMIIENAYEADEIIIHEEKVTKSF